MPRWSIKAFKKYVGRHLRDGRPEEWSKLVLQTGDSIT